MIFDLLFSSRFIIFSDVHPFSPFVPSFHSVIRRRSSLSFPTASLRPSGRGRKAQPKSHQYSFPSEMKPQVHNQGEPRPMPVSADPSSQARRRISSQNTLSNTGSTGVQSSASLTSAQSRMVFSYP